MAAGSSGNRHSPPQQGSAVFSSSQAWYPSQAALHKRGPNPYRQAQSTSPPAAPQNGGEYLVQQIPQPPSQPKSAATSTQPDSSMSPVTCPSAQSLQTADAAAPASIYSAVAFAAKCPSASARTSSQVYQQRITRIRSRRSKSRFRYRSGDLRSINNVLSGSHSGSSTSSAAYIHHNMSKAR